MGRLIKIVVVVLAAQSLAGCLTMVARDTAPVVMPVAMVADWALLPLEATWFMNKMR